MRIFFIHKFDRQKKIKMLIKNLGSRKCEKCKSGEAGKDAICENCSKPVGFDSMKGLINMDCVDSIRPRLLSKSDKTNWHIEAAREIRAADIVVIVDADDCRRSVNASWEINEAEKFRKPVIEISSERFDDSEFLFKVFNEARFHQCFEENLNKREALEMYKLMINTSEALIERRQRANQFYFSAIVGIIGIAGVLFELNLISSESIGLLWIFVLIASLLCVSWYSLLDNYGKLNKAKFRVIKKLEESIGAMIFEAEWQAQSTLDYKSFTSVEKKFPCIVGFALPAIAIFITVWIKFVQEPVIPKVEASSPETGSTVLVDKYPQVL